jgi:hypothetical protein
LDVRHLFELPLRGVKNIEGFPPFCVLLRFAIRPLVGAKDDHPWGGQAAVKSKLFRRARLPTIPKSAGAASS